MHGFSDNGSLVIRGVLTRTINYVGSAVPADASLSEILALCRSWELENIDTGLYKGGGTVFDAFVCTLLAGFITGLVPYCWNHMNKSSGCIRSIIS